MVRSNIKDLGIIEDVESVRLRIENDSWKPIMCDILNAFQSTVS